MLSEAGIILDDDVNGEGIEGDEVEIDLEDIAPSGDFEQTTIQDLERQLDEAIKDEDYERASKIRDELNSRGQS
jgi:excinuclease UvrABC helicase subunit UvrB